MISEVGLQSKDIVIVLEFLCHQGNCVYFLKKKEEENRLLIDYGFMYCTIRYAMYYTCVLQFAFFPSWVASFAYVNWVFILLIFHFPGAKEDYFLWFSQNLLTWSLRVQVSFLLRGFLDQSVSHDFLSFRLVSLFTSLLECCRFCLSLEFDHV